MVTTFLKTYSVSMENRQKQHIFPVRVLFDILLSLPLRIVAVWATYESGYLNISPIFMMTVWGLFKYRDQKRIDKMFKEEVTNSISMRNDRKLVVSNVDPLPSWVYFPDTEGCEWLNGVLNHLWPRAQPKVSKEITQSIEPILNKALSAINLSHFKFRENESFQFVSGSVKLVTIGSGTPRVSGVKVCDKHSSRCEQIVVDMNIFFFSNGDIPFSVSNNDTLGTIANFEIRGCLRTTIFPITMSEGLPIGGLEFSFLRPPQVDFDLKGFVDLMDVRGFRKSLRDTINTIIEQQFVLPNKKVIKYKDRDDLEKYIFPDPKGLLRVNAVEATALAGSDRFTFTSSNSPDPYVTIAFGSKRFSSPVIENSFNPKWNFWADFIIDSFSDDTIIITVDDREGSKNLGKLSLSLKLVEERMKFDSWIQLEEVVTGMIHLCVSYHHLDGNSKLMASNDVQLALLEVRIGDAKNLGSIKKNIRYSVAQISVGEATQLSRPVPIDNPVFGEVFSFVVKSPKTDKLKVKLMGEGSEHVLGNTEFELKHLLEANNMEIIDEQSKLMGADETSRLSISLRLRALQSD